MNVVGLGTDLVEVARFRLAMERRAKLPERLFSDAEREYAFRQKDPVKSLAARFGAKEAVMKAMGVGLWKFKFRDVEVVRAKSGAPSVALHGRAAEMAARAWHRRVAPVADPHGDDGDGGRARAREHRGGDVKPILTPEQMGEADRRTIEAGTPVDVLMERAGEAVAWEARRLLGGAYGRRAVIVCGTGNNGGDGLVTARVLRGWGVRVDLLELGDDPTPETVDRAFGRARSRGRRDVRHRVPR